MTRRSLSWVFAVARKAWEAWRSEDVSRASLASFSMIGGTLFVVVAGLLIWKLPVRPLPAASAILEVVGVMLGVPAVVAALGIVPSREGPRRVAFSNALRNVWRRWYLLILAGTVLLTVAAATVELTLVPRVVPLDVVGWMGALGLYSVTGGVVSALLPRRLVVPLPTSVEVLSPFQVLERPRGDAYAGGASLCFIFLSAVLNFAGSFG